MCNSQQVETQTEQNDGLSIETSVEVEEVDTAEETDIEFHSSPDEDNYFNDYSENQPKEPISANLETDSPDKVYAEIAKDDHAVLNKMLLGELSPELKYNEGQKRGFKIKLMNYIFKTLKVQLIFFLCVVSLFIITVCVKLPFLNNLSVELIESISLFLRYYITAIIAEFIAMLFFIVKFVFDKSIVSLIMRIFKKKD